MIDTEATETCLAAVTGSLAAVDARWHLATLLIESRVCDEVAWGRRFSDAQLSADVADKLSQLIERKIVDPDARGVDLFRIAEGKSFCGWARQFGRTAVASVLRNELAHRHRTRVTSADDIQELSKPAWDEGEDGAAGIDKCLEARFMFGEGLRLNRRKQIPALPHERSKAICDGFDLPSPSRIDDATARRRAGKQLRRDPVLGCRVVESVRNGTGQYDTALSAAFAGYSIEDLDRVLGYGPQVAQALIEAAVSDRPPVPRRVAKAFRRCVTAMVEPTSGWVKASNRLASAFLADRADSTIDPVSKVKMCQKTTATKLAERSELSAAVSAAHTVTGDRRFYDLEAGIEVLDEAMIMALRVLVDG